MCAFERSEKGMIFFMEYLKTTNTEKGKKIETLICEGDGLGIQKRIIS